MAKIDQLLAMLVKAKVDRAVLRGDKPMQLTVGAQQTSGSALTKAQLHRVLQEITPDALQSRLSEEGSFHFQYNSPDGLFDIGVDNFMGDLQASIALAKVQPAAVQPAEAPATDAAPTAQDSPLVPVTAPSPAPAPATVPSPPARGFSLDPAAFVCPVCGNHGVQKVSAIAKSGTWMEQSAWSEQSNWSGRSEWSETSQSTSESSGVSAGAIFGRRTAPVAGVSASKGVSSGTTRGAGASTGSGSAVGTGLSSGANQLTQILAPPAQPGYTPPMNFNGCVVASVVLSVLTLGLALPVLLIASWVSRGEEAKAKEGRAKYETDLARWQEAIARWDLLAYCSRCDHVFNLKTRQHATSSQMNTLLG